jgi:phosphinothricin acetyltransferase
MSTRAFEVRGIGRLMYDTLLPLLTDLGYVMAYAGIALPNRASVALHEAVGFRAIGVFPDAGYKLGAWHDVGWWSRRLRESPDAPEHPRSWVDGL